MGKAELALAIISLVGMVFFLLNLFGVEDEPGTEEEEIEECWKHKSFNTAQEVCDWLNSSDARWQYDDPQIVYADGKYTLFYFYDGTTI